MALELLNVKLVLETLITAWLLIVIVTVTCWLWTGVPLSVSKIVITALITLACAWATLGDTVMVTLLLGATVPRVGDTGAEAAAFASSAIAQLSGALPVLVIVKV